MERMRFPAAFTLVLLILGGAAATAPREQRAPAALPSASDISEAMASSVGPGPNDMPGLMCASVEDVKCAPIGRSGLLECSFRQAGRKARRTAVFERTRRTEWEREGHWRWVRGWRSCGRYL